MPKEYTFPNAFLWGTATSAHQIEGNNKNSDWWEWEQTRGNRKYPLEPSGVACDSYNRYKEDFDLCKKLNNNAVRISVEWARLEPKEGVFDQKEFDHYIKVLKYAKGLGLKTFVTLHHFTNPIWFTKKGGWANFKSPYYFARYAKECAKQFGSLMDVCLTINEPQVYALMSYVQGIWPPGIKNPLLFLLVQINFVRAHIRAFKLIKLVSPNCPVGIVKNIVWYKTLSSKYNILNFLSVAILNFAGKDLFLLPIKKSLDLIGVNYYFTNVVHNLKIRNPNNPVSDLGWWINPTGLEKVLLSLKKYKLPIYITENGLADLKDTKRKKFIKSMLGSCAKAVEKKVPLKGYFHWSLLDNYEWHQGFWPRFGLVKVNRDTLKRVPRKSFYYYASICKNNTIKLR